MYEALKELAMRILALSPEPPEEPAGTHESVQVVRASPRYLTYLLVQWSMSMGVLAFGLAGTASAVAIAVITKGHQGLGLAIWAVAAVILAVKLTAFYVTTRLNYEMRWYIVTDRSLRIREGVWHVQEVTLTFANVQNLNITQGPLQRWFGISDLVVETAGGGSGASHSEMGVGIAHHGVMRGIDNAAEVREKIQVLLRAYKASGLGDPDDRNAPARAVAPASSGGDLVAVLRELGEEAALLRRALVPSS
jgi:uncharacterized membrane protein YdbT with pleckstrin-like domain